MIFIINTMVIIPITIHDAILQVSTQEVCLSDQNNAYDHHGHDPAPDHYHNNVPDHHHHGGPELTQPEEMLLDSIVG